jgi:hypothetical protein
MPKFKLDLRIVCCTDNSDQANNEGSSSNRVVKLKLAQVEAALQHCPLAKLRSQKPQKFEMQHPTKGSRCTPKNSKFRGSTGLKLKKMMARRLWSNSVLAQNSFFSSNDRPKPIHRVATSKPSPSAFTVSSTCSSHATPLEPTPTSTLNRKPRSPET